MRKDNIIQFPIERRLKEIEDQKAFEEMDAEYEIEQFTDECTNVAQLILVMIEDLIHSTEDVHSFDDINFRAKDNQESKDMFVIVNLLSSMLMRWGGVKHFLHNDLDKMFEKLVKEQGYNDFN
tara:strand:+ start:2182 stop:2550 length:369 start_codon:yes stop_codon:yes gene_type:complete